MAKPKIQKRKKEEMDTEITKTIAKINEKILSLRSPQFSAMSLM